MPKDVDLPGKVLGKALELAEAGSWEALHLHEVAAALDITLDDIRQHYRQKDDLVEAWFDRADSAILGQKASQEFAQLSSRERIHKTIMTWLHALAAHRRITGEMLRYKVELGHIHLQVLGVMRVSRTVQWIREAAIQQSTDFQRIVEEVALTSIYLATFAYWLRDDSAGSESTSRFLDGLLGRAEAVSRRLQRILPRGLGAPPSSTPDAPSINASERPTADGHHYP